MNNVPAHLFNLGDCSTSGVIMPTKAQHVKLSTNNNGAETEPEKKMKRVLRNRKAAKASYERKKKMITELHTTVADLTKENREVKSENESLKKEMAEMKKKMDEMMAKLNIGASAAATSATAEPTVVAKKQTAAKQTPAAIDLIEADADGTHPFHSISQPSSTQTSVGGLSNSDLIEDDADEHHPFTIPEMTLFLNKSNLDGYFPQRQSSLGMHSATSLSRNNSFAMTTTTSLSRNGSRFDGTGAQISLSRESSLFSAMSACSLTRNGSQVSNGFGMPPAFFSVTSCGSMGSDVMSFGGGRMMATV